MGADRAPKRADVGLHESGGQRHPDVDGPLEDLRAEVMRVLAVADDKGVVLRATGGLAIYLSCPSSRKSPLARDYKDLDLVGKQGDAARISSLLVSLGYAADEEFNSLHGHQRLFFWDEKHKRQLDVFIEKMPMSHELSLHGRVELHPRTLTLADLLLSKLQVVEVNDRDLKDATALLTDHPIDESGIDPIRIATLLASDWGWWRTVTESLTRTAEYADGIGFTTAGDNARRLLELIEAEPKTMRWKVRAKIGERVRWYELPEEIEG